MESKAPDPGEGNNAGDSQVYVITQELCNTVLTAVILINHPLREIFIDPIFMPEAPGCIP